MWSASPRASMLQPTAGPIPTRHLSCRLRHRRRRPRHRWSRRPPRPHRAVRSMRPLPRTRDRVAIPMRRQPIEQSGRAVRRPPSIGSALALMAPVSRFCWGTLWLGATGRAAPCSACSLPRSRHSIVALSRSLSNSLGAARPLSPDGRCAIGRSQIRRVPQSPCRLRRVAPGTLPSRCRQPSRARALWRRLSDGSLPRNTIASMTGKPAGVPRMATYRTRKASRALTPASSATARIRSSSTS